MVVLQKNPQQSLDSVYSPILPALFLLNTYNLLDQRIARSYYDKDQVLSFINHY